MKKLLLPLVALATLSLISLSANAVCNRTGDVVRVSNTNTTSFIYLRAGALNNFYYVFTATDLDMRAAANAAVASGVRTQIIGNAGSCGTAATGGRPGGVATRIRLKP